MILKNNAIRCGGLILLVVGGIAAWAMSPASGSQVVGYGARWHVVDGGAWSIDHALLWRMRAALASAADASRAQRRAAVAPASAAEWIRPRPDVWSYMVQVQGIMEGGRKVVTVSGSCEDPSKSIDLDKAFFAMADGGYCYFLAMYVPDEGRFVSFDFNGPAL